MVSVTTNGNIPQQPSNWDNSYIPDQLIAGPFNRVTLATATVLHGATINSATVLPRGTVMGQISIGATTMGVVTQTGTGNGVCTKDASTPTLTGAKAGNYTATCTAAATNSGTFEVKDPAGNVIEDNYVVGATFAQQIKFVIADGSADFAVGDKFTFPVSIAAGSGKYVPSVTTATDGSQVPSAILCDQCDPTAADVNAGLYFTGEFNQNAITFDSAWTVAALKPLLRPYSIFLKDSVSASDPS